MQRIIDVACEACRKAENAGLLSRGRLRRAAARTVAEQSELLRRTAPWLKDAAIPGTYAGAAAYRDEACNAKGWCLKTPAPHPKTRGHGPIKGDGG